MKKMNEATRKTLEADRVRRFVKSGMSEADAVIAARKAVRVVELSEARRSFEVEEAARLKRRKELYMDNGMNERQAELAARGR